jgi:hypothetical protein
MTPMRTLTTFFMALSKVSVLGLYVTRWPGLSTSPSVSRTSKNMTSIGLEELLSFLEAGGIGFSPVDVS